VTAEIEGLLDGSDIRAGWAPNEATRLAERFLAGHYLEVADEMNVRADLERLVGLDEAWAFCFRTPAPGWRLLGRFVEPGVFAASVAKDRHDLRDVGTYTATAQKMIDDWERDHGAIPVARLSKTTDYPTGIVHHVRSKKKKA
jgi:hypothetical protein